jgi:hypothetical protein
MTVGRPPGGMFYKVTIVGYDTIAERTNASRDGQQGDV